MNNIYSKWFLAKKDYFDDGSIAFTAGNTETKESVLLEARPTGTGQFDIVKFNRETGAMDSYFSLTVDSEYLVTKESTLVRIFSNALYYLEGGHVEGLANIKIDVGDRVICDFCSTEYTESNESGGFLYGGYATCPDCAPEKLKFAKENGELNQITETCPEGLSFADWVRTVLR